MEHYGSPLQEGCENVCTDTEIFRNCYKIKLDGGIFALRSEAIKGRVVLKSMKVFDRRSNCFGRHIWKELEGSSRGIVPVVSCCDLGCAA